MSDDPDVKRDVVIKLLVTQTEREAMQTAADAEGVTLSEWIRRRCIKTTTTVEVAAPEKRALAACAPCLELVPPAEQPTHRCAVPTHPGHAKLMKTAKGRAQLAASVASGKYFLPMTKKGGK
jgi:hypothetical protein